MDSVLIWRKKFCHSEKCEVRTQQVRMLAAKPNNASSIPAAHTMEGESSLPQLLSDPSTRVVAHSHSLTHK